MEQQPIVDDNHEYICEIENCNKRFKRRDRLIIHERTHTGERPFKCEEPGCDKSYCRQSHLLRHQQNSHTEKETTPVLACTEEGCYSEFNLIQNLQKHIRLHYSTEALNKYKCEEEGCGQTFKKHHELRTHMISHTNVNPCQCPNPDCRRTFQTAAHVRRHMKVHQGYKCDKDGCNLTFSKWSELRRHRSKDHIEEHICQHCNKVYPKRHLLNVHLQSRHEDKSPLHCPYQDCDRKYLDKRNLKTHIRRYHDEECFPCDLSLCGKTFASKQKQKEHMATHDPEYRPRPKKNKKNKKVIHKARKKPVMKSMASRLTGINDKEAYHYLDPVSVENGFPDNNVSIATSESQNIVQDGERGIQVRQDIGTTNNLTTELSFADQLASSYAHIPDSSVICSSGNDTAMKEHLEISDVRYSFETCNIGALLQCQPLHIEQRTVTVPAMTASDFGPDTTSSNMVTLTVL